MLYVLTYGVFPIHRCDDIGREAENRGRLEALGTLQMSLFVMRPLHLHGKQQNQKNCLVIHFIFFYIYR